MYLRLTLPVLLVMAGCATTDAQQTASNATTTQAPCQREYRVGSNIPSKDCTPAMSDADRQRMQDDMRQATKPGAMTKGPGG